MLDIEVGDKLIELHNISKSFPGVKANSGINLDIKKGEIHALLGENGAGKSTLMNILYGLYEQDEGDIKWKGEDVSMVSPHVAIALGIGMIHQHFMLVEKFTVVENIILGTRNEGVLPTLPMAKAAKKIEELSREYGLQIHPWARVEDLSVGEQQRVEIIKALYRGAELLIMDEPTAVLTPQEVDELFKILERLRKEKRSIIFISHKLDEVIKISDRITILRDGQVISTMDKSADLDRGKLAHMMVGRDISLSIEKEPYKNGTEVVLQLEGICLDKSSYSCGLDDIDITVHRGEIFGVAGVDGNGQKELAETVMGLRELSVGKIEMLGKDTTHYSTRKIRKMPVAYIPEDRHNAGMILDFSVQDNLILNKPDENPFRKGMKLNYKAITENAKKLIKEFRIAVPTPDTAIEKLSGGNQQKTILARETGQPVDLVVAVFPTRGLDVDAMRFVYDTMLEARDRGAGVLYISTELEEIMTLSDTIGVLYEGRIIGKVKAEDADLREIGLLMAGQQVEV